MRPKLQPDVCQAGGTAAALIAGGGVEPRLHEKRRPVVVRRVHDLIVDCRAQRRGVAAAVFFLVAVFLRVDLVAQVAVLLLGQMERGQEDRLGPLEVGVAGHEDLGIALGLIAQGEAELVMGVWWDYQMANKGQIRVEAWDLAGNVTRREFEERSLFARFQDQTT